MQSQRHRNSSAPTVAGRVAVVLALVERIAANIAKLPELLRR
jgi:hypothetical protein